MRRKINYEEGTCFFVPLRDVGFARGVVARLDAKGIVFGYFFGPKLTRPSSRFDDVKQENALLRGLFGDLGLLKGAWPQGGGIRQWNRDQWPLPPLYREDTEAQLAWLSHYDDKSLKFVHEERIKFGQPQARQYPHDGIMGYGAAEITLTKLLDNGKSEGRK